jgi:uncharacterized protein YjiS (DUF1127 family)
MNVLIAGDAIGGLATALSLHAVGIKAEVFEQARDTGEAGIGINMLPHSIKELVVLGLLLALDRVGIRTDRAKTRQSFWGGRFWRWCARCSARSRQREALADLDDRFLEDIGVTRQQANAEAAMPFWK